MKLKNLINKIKDYRNIPGPGLFIASLMLVNIINFAFNAYLGRELSFENFALVTFINSLVYIVSIFTNSLYVTANHKVSFLTGQNKNPYYFYKYSLNRLLKLMITTTIVWIILSRIIASFFKVNDVNVLILFTPVITLLAITNLNKGVLQGKLKFIYLSFLIVIEAVVKLLGASVIINFNYPQFAYLSIPISTFIALILSQLLIFKFVNPVTLDDTNRNYENTFPSKFFLAALLTGISGVAFLSIDVLLAKHFLSELDAGKYSLLSLIGKMIFFFGTLFNSLMVTLVSKNQGENKPTEIIFYKVFSAAIIITVGAYLALNIFSNSIIPMLFGAKSLDILPYLHTYSLAMALFTLTSVIIIYHLSREQYKYSIISFLSTIFLIVLIYQSHENITSIVKSIYLASSIVFALSFVSHVLPDRKFFVRAFKDLLSTFRNESEVFENAVGNNKRILIYNWRDTKHNSAGGAEVYIHELAKRCVKEGNKVTVFCGHDGITPQYEFVDGVEIIRKGGFYLVYLWGLINYFTKFRGKFDIVIDSINGAPFMTPFFVKEKLYAIIYHVHLKYYQEYLPLWKKVTAVFVEGSLLPFIYGKTNIITISNSSKKELIELGYKESNIDIVNPGIDLTYFNSGEKSMDPTVLYLGRLSSVKSVDVLIRAFKEIREKVANAKLIIAGGGEELENLFKLAIELKISEYVTFLGKVTEEKKKELLQSAWVFVNPSMLEGWGITTIEANACGTPVVASNVSGLRDSVKNPHSGFLVEYGNVDKLSDRIIEIINNNEKRKYMEKESVEWSKNFDWDKKSKLFLKFIYE